MAAKEMTFEEIDRHVNALDLSAFRPGGRQHFAPAAVQADPGGVVGKVCAIYRGIRPILGAVAAIPLIPKNWKAALQVFLDLMDGLCPGK